MSKKPTYEELEQRINGLEAKVLESRQEEEALQESERFLQDIFDAIKDGISVLDINLKIVRVNSWIEEMYSKEGKFTGRKCYEVYQKRDTPCPWCPCLKTIKTGEIHNAIVPYPSKENPTGWIELSCFPFRNIEGDIVGVIEYAKDITKQKRAEQLLRAERDNLRNIFESIEDGIYIVNQQYDIQYVNPVLVKDFGPYEGAKCYRYFHDRDEICTWCKNKDVFAGKTVRWEWYSLKNGRTYDLIGTPMTLPDGSIGKLEIFRDITDIKQAREVLQESERRLKQAIEGNSIPTFIIDNNHTITHWNKSCEKLTGISAAEIVGTRKAWSAFYAKERQTMADFVVDGATEEEIAGYYEGKSIKFTLIEGAYEGENFYPDLGEKGKWLFFTATPLIDQKGKIVGAIETLQDITDRKQSEEKIREYSEKLESTVEVRTKALRRALYDTEEARDKTDGILKSIADGLIVTDTYTRIILMNRAAEDMLGVRFSEVIDRPIDFAIKDETLRQRFKKSLTKREPGYQFDFELPGENSKHLRIIRARTSEIKDKSGRQTGIITIIYDITLEREVDRMKTEFISTAAHQLRTPLTSILGFSEILMTRDNIKEKEKKEFISYINKQSVNLANIINDLLDISRIESGIGFTLHKVPCNINEIIKEIVKYFQASYPKRQFDIILPKEPVEVKVDKDKIGQVLENILSNAVKYSPEGGEIRLSAELIADFGFRNAEDSIADGGLQNAELEGHVKESAIRNPQSAIQISVADHGIGISPDQVEQMFDKFYRADASDAAIPGTGLGMSIVRNYVEAHGGKVWVESELGKGTTVKFVIPI